MNACPPMASAAPHQPPLRISLSQRVPLVKLDTVIAARGENADTIYARVEDGTLRWVFNLASNPGGDIRDLRFWTREVQAFAVADDAARRRLQELNPGEVIQQILGERKNFHSGEVCLLLGIRRPTLMLLRPELKGEGRQFFSRAGIEQFLKRRLQS